MGGAVYPAYSNLHASMATVYPQQPVMGQAGMMVVPGAPVMMMAPQGAQVLGVGAGGPGLQQLAMILGAQTELHIRQHVPKAAICEGACCEIRNMYYYLRFRRAVGGIGDEAEAALFTGTTSRRAATA